MDIGYIRVSTVKQNTERQLANIQLDKVFEDKCSGSVRERPALEECVDYCREGDILHVHDISRMARDTKHLLSTVEVLNKKGVTVRFYKEGLVIVGNDSPMAKLQLNVVAAISEFHLALINEARIEGIAAAQAKGKRIGKPPKLTTEQKEELYKKYMSRAGTNKQLMEEFDIGKGTFYRAINEMKDKKNKVE